MASETYVVNGKICRIDLEKTFVWTHEGGVEWKDDPEVLHHLEMFKRMKQEGYCLLAPVNAGDGVSYLWFWDDESVENTRVARLVLQRVIGEFDVNTLPNDPVSQWTLSMYTQVEASVQADPYLQGAKLMLYFGGQGSD